MAQHEQVRVVIDGSEGTIGKVLTGYTSAIGEQSVHPKLNAFITRVDVAPERGLNTMEQTSTWRGETYNDEIYRDTTNRFIRSDLHTDLIRRLLRENDVLIHAAWSNEGILEPDSHNPANLEYVQRILSTAAQLGRAATCKIVLLSSVNAHVPADWIERQQQGRYISPSEPPTPLRHNRGDVPGPGLTRYGQTKLEIEELARSYAMIYGLDVVVPRVGGVTMQDVSSSAYAPHVRVAASERGKHFDLRWEDAVHVTHNGFVEHMQRIVDTPFTPGSYLLFNLVSDNPHRVHAI